ncbi:MAG: DUF4230 domain-containing protein [Caldilineales bacterium]|nr:DUF4230 domain-containing protein [Caldilineales bacterium]MCW5861404.1 DUF4230 domain-containing protein [Caldilineales bacterium]
MTRSRKWLTLVTGAVAVAAFALVVSLTSAQTASAHGGPGGLGGRGGTGVSDTYLADALGITAAELQTAQQEANDAAIDQALADGLITQAQADALKQRSGSVWGRELGHFGLLGADTIDMEALLAKALDISTADLQAARVKAQDAALAAAVEAGNITQEQADQMKAQQALQNYFQTQGLQDKIRSLYEDAVNAAVKAGVITQAQADQILSNQSFGFGMRGLGGPDFGMHGFGGRGHGRGGFDGQWFGAPSSGSSSTAPSTTTTPSFFRF